MLLVKPSATICDNIDGQAMLRRIEMAGRTCYKSEDRIIEDSCRKFVAMIISKGHETVLEHEKVTVRFIVDRGVSHEIVRHRIASYSQESTRYCDYEDGHVAFIIPPWCERFGEGISYITTDDAGLASHLEEGDPSILWLYSMQLAEKNYKLLRASGWRPEQARSVLPNSLKTEIVMTANLREWRHFFRLRTVAAAHPQMREVAIPLLHAMAAQIPVIFDDLI